MQRLITYTPPFKLIFPALFTPYVNKHVEQGGRIFYGCTALFEREADLTQLYDRANKMALTKFSEKSIESGHVRFPLKPGKNVGAVDISGHFTLNMKSQKQPYLKDACSEIEHDQVFTADEDTFYPGCLCFAEVEFYCYDMAGFKGVGTIVHSVTKLAEARVTPEQAEFFALPLDLYLSAMEVPK